MSYTNGPQFRVFTKMIANISKENELPKDHTEYDFVRPENLSDGDPPIASSLLLHFYNYPEHSSDESHCFPIFPKKRKYPFRGGSSEANEGYGIYFKEGLDDFLFALIRFSIILSVGFIAWIIFLSRLDLQHSYPWAAVLWISTAGICALEVVSEWLKRKFESALP